MLKFWNSLKYIIIIWFIGIFWFQNFSFWQTYESTDLLQQVFEKALDYESVLQVWWRTSSQVWHEVLRWWTSIQAWESRSAVCLDPETDAVIYMYVSWQKLTIDNEVDCNIAWWRFERDILDTVNEPPLVVKVTKLLLRITMILAITMVIFSSVKLMIEIISWKVDLKSSWAKKNLINIIIWILIALFSVTIINLVMSIPKSSISTSNDYTVVTNNL